MYLMIKRPFRRVHSKGFTLVELMIALAISLVVSLATVKLSANVFSSNTQLIHMTQLTAELRSAMQIISRDVRRAGYDADALAGFLSTQAIMSGITVGDVDANGTADCLLVNYDDISEERSDQVANVVYRLRTIAGVGRISVHYGENSSCDTSITDAGWTDMSDPLLMNITALQFVHNDSLTDIAENLSNGHMIQVGVEQVSITISAALIANATISRSITDEVQIRNQYLRV
ncbi:MAG: prepilin-type N-terminal cleavage/methylation domain-containing protein [Lysobacterales bacterium]